MIIKENDKWCVKSKDGQHSFGCYKTEEQAQKRLEEIHRFSEIGKKMNHRNHTENKEKE